MIKRSWTFRWIASFLFWLEKIKKIFFYRGIFFLVFPRASDTSLSSYLIWNRVFEIFNTWWSYDKFLIDSVWSGQTGNYLALGHNIWTKRIGPTRSSRTWYDVSLEILMSHYLFVGFQGDIYFLENARKGVWRRQPNIHNQAFQQQRHSNRQRDPWWETSKAWPSSAEF